MLEGTVLTFRPAQGSGTIVTSNGEMIRFSGAALDSPLAGGDTVTFETEHRTGAQVDAATIQIIQRGLKCHNEADVTGIHQFFGTVQLSGLEPAPLGV